MELATLEQRQLFAAAITDGVLRVDGTSGDDTITIAATQSLFTVTVNDQPVTFHTADVRSVAVYGGAGNDTIDVSDSTGRTLLDGGDGDDIIVGSPFSDTITGDAGNDYIDGATRPDLIDGGDGNDTLNGAGGDDTLLGGLGDDSLAGGRGKDSLDAQAGDDTLFGGAGNDTLLGGAGRDMLFGQQNNDYLYGQKHNDTLDGGAGADYLSGGDGSDTVDYSARMSPVTVTLGASVAGVAGNDGEAGENDDDQPDVETVSVGTGQPPATAHASNGHDDSAYLQGLIDAAQESGKPVLLPAGKSYIVRQSLLLHDGSEITTLSGVATISASGAFPIFKVVGSLSNVRLENLYLTGNHATGLGGGDQDSLAWSTVENCSFNTDLSWGIDANTLGLTVRDSRFGFDGGLNNYHRHIRIRGKSGGGGDNLNTFDSCLFFNAAGSDAIELEGGYLWSFSHCDFELNRITDSTIHVFGCRGLDFDDNWFEGNTGTQEFQFDPDAQNGQGTHGVTIENNLFSRHNTQNDAIIGIYNVFSPLVFRGNTGNISTSNSGGQLITVGFNGNDGGIAISSGNTILGYDGNLAGIWS